MARKPTAISTSTFNLNDLPSDRRFEELLHRIFEHRVKDDLKNTFDSAILMPGVAEQGRDVLLVKDGKNTGLVQCKKYKGNLGRPEAAKEILKFVLYYLTDNKLIHDVPTFQYYLAVSDKFSTPAINLLKDFKNEILAATELQTWTEELIKKYTTLSGLSFASIENQLKNTLSLLNITQITSSNINSWLNKYEDITHDFFEVKKVIDDINIKKVVEILNPDLEKQIPTFLTSYYRSANNILDNVKFIGYDVSVNRPQNIKVSELYVEPLFKEIKQKKSNLLFEDDTLELNNVFEHPKHYVFLGDPGAGKSLTVKNLVLQFITKNARYLGNYDEYIPFRIELRKYNESRKKQPCNLVSYFVELLKSEYQLQEVNDKLINHILLNKPTIIFFDGLDEIFDLADKNTVCDSILGFLGTYQKIKCIVTSRFIGYDNNAFSNKLFTEFSIQNFNSKQIDEFVDKFYTTQIQNEDEQQLGAKDCKNQLLKMDNQLKSNPLILSLMALLAINNTIIPDSKLKVYEACTNTLVEKRDRDEKQLNITLRIKSKQGAFGSLAFWRYCQMTKGGKVSQELSKQAITEYLIEKKEYEDRDEAEEVAKHFLEYAEKRSIYFDDNFTHKTFLEYYTADFIFRKFHNAGKIPKRDEIINQHIQNVAWHIVFELLIAKIDDGLDDTEVLDHLFESHLKADNPEINYFFLGILDKVVNISDDIRKKVFRNVINLILCKKEIKEEGLGLNPLFSLFGKIATSPKLKEQIQYVLYDIENSLKDEADEISFYCFYYEFIKDHENDVSKLGYECANLNEKIKKLSFKNINLFNFNSSKINIFERITQESKCFGVVSVFTDTRFVFRKSTTWVSPFSVFISDNKFDSYEDMKAAINEFEKIGITLSIIKSNFKSVVYYEDKKIIRLNNLLTIYINHDDEKVDEFIFIIVSNQFKRELKDVKPEFLSNPKFNKLMERIK